MGGLFHKCPLRSVLHLPQVSEIKPAREMRHYIRWTADQVSNSSPRVPARLLLLLTEMILYPLKAQERGTLLRIHICIGNQSTQEKLSTRRCNVVLIVEKSAHTLKYIRQSNSSLHLICLSSCCASQTSPSVWTDHAVVLSSKGGGLSHVELICSDCFLCPLYPTVNGS